MITTPFGMKGCVEYNTEHVMTTRDETSRIELMYDIFAARAGGLGRGLGGLVAAWALGRAG